MTCSFRMPLNAKWPELHASWMWNGPSISQVTHSCTLLEWEIQILTHRIPSSCSRKKQWISLPAEEEKKVVIDSLPWDKNLLILMTPEPELGPPPWTACWKLLTLLKSEKQISHHSWKCAPLISCIPCFAKEKKWKSVSKTHFPVH